MFVFEEVDDGIRPEKRNLQGTGQLKPEPVVASTDCHYCIGVQGEWLVVEEHCHHRRSFEIRLLAAG
jgi:hypothetical protein